MGLNVWIIKNLEVERMELVATFLASQNVVHKRGLYKGQVVEIWALHFFHNVWEGAGVCLHFFGVFVCIHVCICGRNKSLESEH